MTTPPPVDLSRLGSILGKAAAVMNKVEKENPKKQSGQIQESYEDNFDYVETPPKRQSSRPAEMYSESDEREMSFDNYVPSGPSNVYNYSDEQVMNSKLPDSIKKVMMEKRVPKFAAPPSKFTAEDIAKVAGIPLKGSKQQLSENIKRPVNQGDTITVSKSQLNEMVNSMVEKKLLEYFTKSYNKMVTQETVKATITTLIKEGKITPKVTPKRKSI